MAARTWLYAGGIVMGSYALFKWCEASDKSVPGQLSQQGQASSSGRAGIPAAGYRAPGEPIYNEKKMMAEVRTSDRRNTYGSMK